MSSNETQKVDQIAHRLYTKLTIVVNHARATIEAPSLARVDKWFNLETDSDLFKEHTRIYRSISSTADPIPPFQLQVVLVVPELAANQVLVYIAPDLSKTCLASSCKYILLESWDLVFSRDLDWQRSGEDRPDASTATMYKHIITLFRSSVTLLRILPAWKLARRLRRRPRGNGANFTIELHAGDVEGGRTLGFDTPPARDALMLKKDTRTFPAILHPQGALKLSVTYLTTPHFDLVERESLLSSQFFHEGVDFTPTLVRHSQRESISSSPGRLAQQTALPSSHQSSVADQFILPPPISSRTASFPITGGGSPRMQTMALPSVRRLSNAGMGLGGAGSLSGLSEGSSRQGGASIVSRDEGPSVSALAARLRRESTGAGRGMASATSLQQELSSSPGPVPIRRGPITPVYPFKSSTLSSGSPSPSVRQHSPLGSLPSAGPSLPSRPIHSPTSSRVGVNVPLMSSRAPSSPATPFRPSPPLAPSSFGERRSLGSAEGIAESPRMGGAKRYSSSFGYRYAATGGVGSEGSAGSAGREGERAAGASFLSNNTDDDDISAFVQAIDARRPLAGLREQSTPPPDEPLDGRPNSANVSRPSSELARARTMSMPGPMLATESAVDERLREMSEAFKSTLRGLGGRRRRAVVGANVPQDEPAQECVHTPVDEGIALPATYVRPRYGSMGSVRSGFSIASGEVIGRMDPEVGGDPGRSAR